VAQRSYELDCTQVTSLVVPSPLAVAHTWQICSAQVCLSLLNTRANFTHPSCSCSVLTRANHVAEWLRLEELFDVSFTRER
jgi:hypothetical protein